MHLSIMIHRAREGGEGWEGAVPVAVLASRSLAGRSVQGLLLPNGAPVPS